MQLPLATTPREETSKAWVPRCQIQRGHVAVKCPDGQQRGGKIGESKAVQCCKG